MRSAIASSILIPIFALVGCGGQVTSYYQTAEFGASCPDDIESSYEVKMYTLPGVPSGSFTVKDLPAEASASYIAAMSKLAETPEELNDILARPILAISDDTSENRRRITKRFVLSVAKNPWMGTLRPPDRIAYSRAVLELSPGSVFVNATKLETEDAVYDLGSLKQTITGTASATLTPVPLSPYLTANTLTLGATNAVEENTNFKVRGEKLTPIIDANEFALIRTGERDVDLTGSAIVDLTMNLGSPGIEWTFFDSDKLFSGGKAIPYRNATLRRVVASTAYLEGTVEINYHVEAYVRRVESGRSTRQEGDDHAVYMKCEFVPKNNRPITIAEAGSEIPNTIFIERDSPKFIKKLSYIENGSEKGIEVAFERRDSADRFLRWLRIERPVDGIIGNGRLGFQDGKEFEVLNESEIDGLSVYIIQRAS